MKLQDMISKKAVVATLKSSDKRGVITEIVTAMKKAYPAEKMSIPEVVDAILKRETNVGSTGLGSGVAIPHAHFESLKNVIGGFGRSATPIEFGAVDGQPVYLFFLIVSPTSKKEAYIECLQKTSSAIRTPNFLKFLRTAKTPKDIDDIFREAEEELAKV